MFIAIIGTRSAGKKTLQNYLITAEEFIPLRLERLSDELNDGSTTPRYTASTRKPSMGPLHTSIRPLPELNDRFERTRVSFLSMSSPSGPTDGETQSFFHSDRLPITFTTIYQMLEHVTRNWRSNFVTLDLDSRDLIENFVKRPFFMLVSVDAPLMSRYNRLRAIRADLVPLDVFVREDDALVFGEPGSNGTRNQQIALQGMRDLVDLHIVNSFVDMDTLMDHFSSLNILDSNRLRPKWDTYFMTLASLASRRSNCMKRRVGAILVRSNRILSTGYNGTPRGLRNCNEGGCAHCNDGGPTECLCLHAEENALLEVGRERIGTEGAVLYCNTCPCLKCTIKIIQTGIKQVVYNLTYKVDDASARLFKEAGVVLRRFDPNGGNADLAAETPHLSPVTHSPHPRPAMIS